MYDVLVCGLGVVRNWGAVRIFLITAISRGIYGIYRVYGGYGRLGRARLSELRERVGRSAG